MSWFSSLFSSNSPQSTGQDVLRAYFDEAVKFPNFPFSSFEPWLSDLNSKVPEFDVLIGELVLGNEASTTVDEAINRAYSLANESGGTATAPQIVMAAGGRGDTINWWVGLPEIAKDTAENVYDTAVDVGTGVWSTISLTKYLPWILAGGAVIYLTTVGKGHGKALMKMVGKKS